MKRIITSVIAVIFFMGLTTASFAQYGTTKTANPNTTVNTAKPTRPRSSIKITTPKVTGRSIYEKRRKAKAAQAAATAPVTMKKDDMKMNDTMKDTSKY